MSKKVLHVFGIMNRGGAELRTLSLMKKMREREVLFEFCVLSGKEGVLDQQILKLGGKVHYCRLGLTFPWRFLRILRENHYDVVHSHVSLVSGLVLFISRLARVSLRIAHFRNTTDGASATYTRRFRDQVLKLLLLVNANRILGVCNGALDGYWHNRWPTDKRFSVLYNGFPLPQNTLLRGFWYKYIANFNNGTVIINVARMDYQKNHIRQVQIFSQYLASDATAWLVFVGKESAVIKQKVTEFAEQSGISDRVVFLGEQADVLPFLKHASAMLFPSMWEGLPGAVVESASVGLPVLASNIPGVEEIARQLPIVKVFDLNEDDRQWGSQLRLCIQNAQTYDEAVHAFENSEFLLTSNVDKLHGIYCE